MPSLEKPMTVAAGQRPPIGLQGIVGHSDAFNSVWSRVRQVASTDATVLLLGETGTGKGLTAQAIHEQSRRRKARFLEVNCAALPSNLIESELFGRERGAFTDATCTQVGRFELASGGTIFLDEIGEIPFDLQSKLLRVLEDGTLERLGSPRTIRVDVRIIAATNRDLVDEVARGRFRRDLYYRLNVFPISMPPLRARRSDIAALTTHFVDTISRRHGRTITNVPASVLAQLEDYDWPGNVRELQHVLERAIIACEDGVLRLTEHLRPARHGAAELSASTLLTDVERGHILRVLGGLSWRIEGRAGAAAALGLKPSTLRSRMNRLGIQRCAAAV